MATFFSRINSVNASNMNNLGIFFVINEPISSMSIVNSFRDEIRIKCTLYFHLYFKSRCFWRNLHHWQKFYTASGSDVIDKFLWINGCFPSKWAFMRIAQMGKGARWSPTVVFEQSFEFLFVHSYVLCMFLSACIRVLECGGGCLAMFRPQAHSSIAQPLRNLRWSTTNDEATGQVVIPYWQENHCK